MIRLLAPISDVFDLTTWACMRAKVLSASVWFACRIFCWIAFPNAVLLTWLFNTASGPFSICLSYLPPRSRCTMFPRLTALWYLTGPAPPKILAFPFRSILARTPRVPTLRRGPCLERFILIPGRILKLLRNDQPIDHPCSMRSERRFISSLS